MSPLRPDLSPAPQAAYSTALQDCAGCMQSCMHACLHAGLHKPHHLTNHVVAMHAACIMPGTHRRPASYIVHSIIFYSGGQSFTIATVLCQGAHVISHRLDNTLRQLVQPYEQISGFHPHVDIKKTQTHHCCAATHDYSPRRVKPQILDSLLELLP